MGAGASLANVPGMRKRLRVCVCETVRLCVCAGASLANVLGKCVRLWV